MKAQEERRQGNPKREAQATGWEERQQGKHIRDRQEGDTSRDRELQGVFMVPPGLTEKLQEMAGPNSKTREKRLLQGEATRDKEVQKEENYRGNGYPREEKSAPRMEMAVMIRLLREKRTALGTESKSRMPRAKGVGGGPQGVNREHLDPHAEGRTRGGKSAPFLNGGAKKAMEQAAAWGLSLLGAV